MTNRAPQGGFQDWAELRHHLIERYGTTPHPSTEQEIIDAYQLHPDAVTKAALDLIDAANVTSHWGVLKARAAKIAAPPANPARTPSLEKEKRIAHADQWIKAAGIHYDRDTEILLELFSGSGLLASYAHIDLEPDATTADAKWRLSEPTGDTTLIERILKTYHDARPTGIAIEAEALERAEKFKRHQTELREALARAHAELAAKQTELATIAASVAEDPPADRHDESTPNDDIPF